MGELTILIKPCKEPITQPKQKPYQLTCKRVELKIVLTMAMIVRMKMKTQFVWGSLEGERTTSTAAEIDIGEFCLRCWLGA